MNRGTTGTGLNSTGMMGGGANMSGGRNTTTGSGMNSAANQLSGASGLRAGALYATRPAFQFTPIQATTVRADLQDIVSRSSSIMAPGNVSVHAEGSMVVLRGFVANEQERLHVENMMRLNPGVYQVRNDLQIRP